MFPEHNEITGKPAGFMTENSRVPDSIVLVHLLTEHTCYLSRMISEKEPCLFALWDCRSTKAIKSKVLAQCVSDKLVLHNGPQFVETSRVLRLERFPISLASGHQKEESDVVKVDRMLCIFLKLRVFLLNTVTDWINQIQTNKLTVI